jgi:hypothetical protein
MLLTARYDPRPCGFFTKKIKRHNGSTQIPDKGFLPSANSGMTDVGLFFGVMSDAGCC